MDLKDFYAKALLLPDNELIVVRYEITKRNIGKIQLSNSVKLLDIKTTKKLKDVLRFIEEYATDYHIIPCQDAKIC
jgi:hypothetical protein